MPFRLDHHFQGSDSKIRDKWTVQSECQSCYPARFSRLRRYVHIILITNSAYTLSNTGPLLPSLSKGECSLGAIEKKTDKSLAWNTAQGAKGGCDGSIALAPGEIDRSENKGLANITTTMKDLAAQYKVGVADMIGTFVFSSAVNKHLQLNILSLRRKPRRR